MVALLVSPWSVIFHLKVTFKPCSNGHVSRRAPGFPRERLHISTDVKPHYSFCHTKAAFDRRVLASVCFFATDIHSATLGKGEKDDSLERVDKGDLTGKGELVVC